MALITAADGLAPTSPATVTAGADAQLIAANSERNGLQIVVDTAGGASPVYLLLRSGAASATNFDMALAAGGSWNGQIGNVVWRGAVRSFSAGTPKIGVLEV